MVWLPPVPPLPSLAPPCPPQLRVLCDAVHVSNTNHHNMKVAGMYFYLTKKCISQEPVLLTALMSKAKEETSWRVTQRRGDAVHWSGEVSMWWHNKDAEFLSLCAVGRRDPATAFQWQQGDVLDITSPPCSAQPPQPQVGPRNTLDTPEFRMQAALPLAWVHM